MVGCEYNLRKCTPIMEALILVIAYRVFEVSLTSPLGLYSSTELNVLEVSSFRFIILNFSCLSRSGGA